jgi:hypothetical protein
MRASKTLAGSSEGQLVSDQLSILEACGPLWGKQRAAELEDNSALLWTMADDALFIG